MPYLLVLVTLDRKRHFLSGNTVRSDRQESVGEQGILYCSELKRGSDALNALVS
jgi:hypothetical protein